MVSKSLNNQTSQNLSNIYNQGSNANRTPLAPVGKETLNSSLGGSWEPNYQSKTKK